MSFKKLQRIWEFLRNNSVRRSIEIWHKGDPVYYRDDPYNIADVVRSALQHSVRIDSLNTHGFVAGEVWPKVALEKLVDSINANPDFYKKFVIFYSVDPYGWQGIDDQLHWESMRETMSVLAKLKDKTNCIVYPYANSLSGDPAKHTTNFKERVGKLCTQTGLNQPTFGIQILKTETAARLLETGDDFANGIGVLDPGNFAVINFKGELEYLQETSSGSHRVFNFGNIFGSNNQTSTQIF
jgi:hypothetical protein